MRTGAIRRRLFVEPLPYWNDQQLVHSGGGALRGRIESAQRFHHVADELETDRLGIAGRKDVDDAASDREGSMLFNRVLPRKSCIDEQVREVLRIDLRSRADLQ